MAPLGEDRILIKEKEISEVKTYMRCKKNITLKLENISSHFTGKNKIITLSLIILMLSLINITLGSSNNLALSLFGLSTSSVSALSYESEVGIGFSFNPTLTISFSSSDLAIDNLVPGSSSDSNVINVNVSTNASHGYTLAVNTNSDSLVHSNNSNVFSSIGTDASIESLTSDNTWGYSYKLSNDTTWSNYSGLSSSTTKTLVNTDNQSSKPIDFKIGAKASTTQASGEYTNIINFIAVSKPIPRTIDDIVYMQTFSELVPTDLQSVKNSMVQNHTYILKDARDEQDYTVAKLNDDKIWMTKNLSLAGSTEITSELSDIPENYTLPTANGFQEGNRLPASSQEGFSDNSQAYVYNSGNNTDNCSNPGCYSYYSWHAATAGSGIDIITNNTDAPYSICPKGWKLPTSRSYASTESDFYNLAVAYGMNPDVVNDQSIKTVYEQIGPGTIANYLQNGYYENNAIGYNRQYGYYWSSIKTTYFGIGKGYVQTYMWYYNRTGFGVRCLAK